MTRITRSGLAALVDTKSASEFFIWDDEIKGFGVRVKPSGFLAFVLKYRIGRTTKRLTISKVGSPYTVEQARRVAAGMLRDVLEGRDPAEAKRRAREALTVAEMADLYLAEGPAAKPNKKAVSWDGNRYVLTRHVKPLIGNRIARDLTKADITRLQSDVAAGKTALTERGKPRGVTRVRGGKRVAAICVVTLGSMFEWAISTGRADHNPAHGVERFKSQPRERFLSETEIVLLADALTALETTRKVGAPLADAIRLLMVTGCRKSEIMKMKRAWVDFEGGRLRLPDSKTGARVITLAAPALAILARQEPKPGNPYMFPGARGEGGHATGLQRAWELTRARATRDARKAAVAKGLPVERAANLMNVRLHDLRHTFASVAVADGTSLLMVGKVLGHRQARTTEIYAHLADDPIRKVKERTAAKIAALMAPKQKDDGETVVPIRSAG